MSIRYVVHSFPPPSPPLLRNEQSECKQVSSSVSSSPPRPPGETSAPSPDTVTETLDVPAAHAARCQRAPFQKAEHRALMVEATHLLNRSYTDLVRRRFISQHDVDEQCSPSARLAFQHPLQDPSGTLTAAVTMARYLIREDLLDKQGMNINVRTLLATCLFLCHKLKMEAQFREGTYAQITVLSQFLNDDETPYFGWKKDHHSRRQYQATMWRLEGEILNTQPVYELVDNNPFVGCEVALKDMLEATPPLMTRRQACIALSSVNYFMNAAAINPELDLMEELGRNMTAAEIGASLAVIGYVAQMGRVPYTMADRRILFAASKLACNALWLGERAYVGVYRESSAPVWNIVGKGALLKSIRILEEGCV